MLFWLVVIGAGCLWQGALIIWVAPTPSVLSKKPVPKPQDSAQAFQLFWLDQYAWIGIGLSVLGISLLIGAVVL